MSVTYEIDTTDGRVCTSASGVVTIADLIQHVESEQRDGAIGLPEIVDARGASTDVTSSQIRELVNRTNDFSQMRQVGPLAVVTDSDVLYGMTRMYQILCDDLPMEIGVFRNLDQASEWLDTRSSEPPSETCRARRVS
jgi:hypothetical protein